MYIPLEQGESVVLQVHKHWWFIFVRIVALGVFLVVPLLVWHVMATAGWVVVTQGSTSWWAG
jgi:hypothetical protein